MADVKDKTETPTATPMRAKVVEVPRLTPDQLEFLRNTNLRPGSFDRNVVVGGPSRVRRPTA